ncbi:hypothetical protein RIF29_18640 [Crotalaria pallida]|uniref:Uncharacterized protein n=1 Tax=Crotalaria pallida TaxID=3830 RepID=A0AAN9I4T1_CROPI
MAGDTFFYRTSRQVRVNGSHARYVDDDTHGLFAVSVGMEDPNLGWLSDWFKNISCKTVSPRILHGEFSQENIPALGPGDHNTLCYYFIYEYGQPLADHASVVGGVNNPSYFLIIRDVLEAIYDLRNKHRICHRNIRNDGNAIVVSKSGGKLGAGIGCGYSKCDIHWIDDLRDLFVVVNHHLNNLVQNYHQYRLYEFLQFLGWLPFQHRYFDSNTPFRLLAGHPIWMSSARRMHMRISFFNQFKRLTWQDRENFRGCCRNQLLQHRLAFGGWIPFAMQYVPLKNVLTYPTFGEQAEINVAYQDVINVTVLNQEDRQERLIMTFLKFGRNCASHIKNLGAAAIEDLLERNWPGLLIVAYDIMVESITNPHNWDPEV